MAKRVNAGYMSGYYSQGSLRTRDMTPSHGHREKPREIDAGVDVCLTCKRKECTGKCKNIKDRKVRS